MKYNQGIAPILIILIVVVVGGGATYAVVQRSVLKSFFEKGDKPTEAQFADTIDSSLNLTDDGDLTDSKVYNPTKAYVAGDTVVKSDIIYQAKALGTAQTNFKLDSAQSVTFSWKSLVSKPTEGTTYRLKVWQLMQGQTGSQAMKSNQPVMTKDVTSATEVTVSGLYTGPCKPPYLCDFVWSIEAVAASDTKTSTSGSTSPATIEGSATVEIHSDLDGTHH